MEWTGPAAIGISAAATVISLMAWWQARRSAIAAEDSATSARRDVDLNAQRFEREHPSVSLELVRQGKIQFLIRNSGRLTVRGIRVTVQDPDTAGLARGLPDGIRLEPGEASHLFQLIPTDNVPQPAQLRVEYDGMTAPVFLPVV